MSGGSGALLPRMEFRTSRSALHTAEDPDTARFEEFLSELGPNSVAVLAEGGTEPQRRAFMEEMASRLEREKSRVRDVFYRVPVDFFQARALGLAPLESLKKLAAALEKEAPTLAALSSARGVADLNRLLGKRIEGEFKSGRKQESDDLSGLRALHGVILGEKKLIEHPAQAAKDLEELDPLALLQPRDPRLAHEGFLTSRDGSMYVALVQPPDTGDEPQYLESFLGTIRAAAEGARKERPAIQYGLAGVPVTIVEESETVARDAPVCSLIAALGIGLLAALAFRRKVAVLLVLISLGMGILWNVGLTWAIFGGLNLITSAVPVILLALGIDFGIHVVVAYEAERARGLSPEESLAQGLLRIGPALTTGAVTTALAFYAICFMEYQGFREFGVIAGNGVLVCLAAMVSGLPALLLLTDRRPARLPSAPVAALTEELVDEPPDLPPASRLRSSWRRICRASTAFPVASTLVGAVVTGYFFYLARSIDFDYRVEDLLPRDSESLRVEAKLKRDPSLSGEFAAAFYRDLESLRAADQRAGKQPLIARRESILDLLPPGDRGERKAAMDRIQELLKPLSIDPARLSPVDPADLKSSLEELSSVFQRALDLAATQTGVKELLQLLDGINTGLDSAAASVQSAPAGWKEEFSAAQERVWRWAQGQKVQVEKMLTAGPVEEKDLPRQILDRLKGAATGRYVLYLYPKESMDDRKAVERFVEAARAVDPAATGYPIAFYASTSLIHRGFSTAVIAAAVVIFLTLFVDFRRPWIVLLATLPKVVGIIWMLGIMRLLGLNYNLANQIVIPLIIGVGLSYGIHIIHRFMMQKPGQRNITRVLEHTGGAIALSGLTTMIGFGSLALAQHRGLASMGTVLFFGVGAALIASTYVLANLLCLIYRPAR
jgi:predicted RND superfamily exporter protein